MAEPGYFIIHLFGQTPLNSKYIFVACQYIAKVSLRVLVLMYGINSEWLRDPITDFAISLWLTNAIRHRTWQLDIDSVLMSLLEPNYKVVAFGASVHSLLINVDTL